jgi:hypothetical protein
VHLEPVTTRPYTRARPRTSRAEARRPSRTIRPS